MRTALATGKVSDRPFDFRFLTTGAYCCRDNCFRSLYGSRSSLYGYLPRLLCGGWRSPSELGQYVGLESLFCPLLPSERTDRQK